MTVKTLDTTAATAAAAAPPDRGAATRPRNPEEAARQFEETLVRELVRTMTASLFKSGLAGDDAPGWMAQQADAQRDALTDVITQHLVSRGGLDLRERLLQQWQREAITGGDGAAEASGEGTAAAG